MIKIEEIIRRLEIAHQGVVCIIPESYRGVAEKATFVDRDYGEWQATPHRVCKRGHGHPKRKALKVTIAVEEVKKRVYEKHKDKLVLDEKTYRIAGEKARFIDKDYGEWWTVPSQVMLGVEHPQRSYDRYRLNMDEIKERIFERHGDLVTIKESTYTSVDERAVFIDKELGEWSALPGHVFSGYGHPKRKGNTRRIKIKEVKEKLIEKYGDLITIDESTYERCSKKARFLDKEFGEWWQYPKDVLHRGTCHPKRSKINKMTTNMLKYGCVNPAQNKEISLRIAMKLQTTTIKIHWKTGEQLVCQAGWEPKIVDYLNQNKIDFLWQPKTFETPITTKAGNKSTYRPDLFLTEQNIWVEIKGYMRPHSKLKWEWFHSENPNSEIWGEEKLISLNIKIRS